MATNNPENLPAYMEMPLTKTGEVQLSTFKDAFMLCDWVVKAGFAPRGKDTAQQVFIAAQMGASLGLNFWASLTNIMVVNGTPTIWGDAMLALVQDHRGAHDDGRPIKTLEYFSEYMVGNLPNDNAMAVCIAKRRGVGLEVDEIFLDQGWAGVVTAELETLARAGWSVSTFSVFDAKTANLWKKAGPWSNFPARMMQMRARSITLRNAFADLLKGFRAYEEVQGTVIERDDQARQLDIAAEVRDTTAADYQEAELAETPAQEPGLPAGMESPPEQAQANEAETADIPAGDDKDQPEIVQPGASDEPENPPNPAEDPLNPANLAVTPPEPEIQDLPPDAVEEVDEEPPIRLCAACEKDISEEPIEYQSQDPAVPGIVCSQCSARQLLADASKDHGPECECDECLDLRRGSGSGPGEIDGETIDHHGPECECDECLDLQRGSGVQPPAAATNIESNYWEALMEKVGGQPYTIVHFREYNEHILKISQEEPSKHYARAIANIDGHIANCQRWRDQQQVAKNMRDEKTAAAKRPEPRGPLGDNKPEAPVSQGNATRIAYTKEMLDNPERQKEDDPDFDPLRYVNVKSKRGAGVKGYYERHLDKMIAVLSNKTVDWAEWILEPHRKKWMSIALTKALPFPLDVAARADQAPNGQEPPQESDAVREAKAPATEADEMRLRGLKDKIRSYENYNAAWFQEVLTKTKRGANPMTIWGAEKLLEDLQRHFQAKAAK